MKVKGTNVTSVRLIITIVVVALISSSVTFQQQQLVYAKGLKVFLTIDTNQRSQDVRIETYQHGNQINTRTGFTNTGITELTLQYAEGLIETGDFRICVTALSDNLYACGNGYNSEEKKPEYVSVNLFRSLVYADEDANSNSASSSSSSSNSDSESNSASTSSASIENTNENIIVICPESGGTCKVDP
jgi:hypothetical protein